MSKSLNNAICFNDSPKDIFGKTMSIPDNLIYKYFRLCTNIDESQLENIKKELDGKKVNPRDLKVRLAYELVRKYYDEGSANKAREEFEKIFVKKETPDEIPLYLWDNLNLKLSNILKENGLTESTSEANRKIREGAVTIDGEKIFDINFGLKNISKTEFIIKVGNRKFLKVRKNFL